MDGFFVNKCNIYSIFTIYVLRYEFCSRTKTQICRMKNNYFSFILIVLVNITFAQSEDESCLPPNKKVEKMLITAINSPDPAVAVANFNDAMDAAPENATVYYEYGMYAYLKAEEMYAKYPNPAMGDKNLLKAEEMFMEALEHCTDYNADVFYYLGVINYSQGDQVKSTEWFKKFLAFKSSDASKYSEDHAKKVADVKEVVGEMQDEIAIKTSEVPYNPVIVQNVSSKDDEYFPMISPDNELMFFTRKVDDRQLGDNFSTWREKYTVAERPNASKLFNSGVYLGNPFNDGKFDNYGASTLSVDNKEMILCACKVEDVNGQQYKNCDLYITTFERSGNGGNDFMFTELVNMGPAINTKDGWEGQPSLSADGNTLFYTTNRNGSRDNDIYISTRKPDGTWSQARAFDEINTDGKDKSPFLHQDSETLYFVSTVSEKRKGVGGLDIFYTRKENGKWTEPKNIGFPINSEEDELGLFVSTDGKLAYFSSRYGGNWNIYAFELYEEARPKPVAILKGELKDEHGSPVEDAIIEIAYEGSDEVTQVKVNGTDGKYAAVVKTDTKQDVMVTVKKEGHAFDSKVISKETIESNKDVSIRNNDLDVKELKVGEAYTINDILYATNSAELNNRSKFILKGFARFLNENPTIQVAIQGHTDDVGDDGKNMTLSEQRAQGVKSYLISLGIKANRLESKGYGETKPKVENTSEANRAMNRRTDFVIVGM